MSFYWEIFFKMRPFRTNSSLHFVTIVSLMIIENEHNIWFLHFTPFVKI